MLARTLDLAPVRDLKSIHHNLSRFRRAVLPALRRMVRPCEQFWKTFAREKLQDTRFRSRNCGLGASWCGLSAISAGTELAHREQVEKSIIGKALARPDLVRQVFDFARTAGVKAAYQKVQSRLDMLAPLGYSCAGVVIAAGQEAQEFHPVIG